MKQLPDFIFIMAFILACMALFAALALSAPVPFPPGAVFEDCTPDVMCKPGYTHKVRHVTDATKRRICKRDEADKCPGPGWEVDHFIPLELCGSNEDTNLWAQSIEDARKKDIQETKLHDLVCAGKMTLIGAQFQIRLGRW